MALFGPLKPFENLAEHQGEHKLKRTLSWPHLIALGIGAIIGMGIFTLTGVGARLAGPSVIVSFAIAGVICACAALAYAEVATLVPASGSAYTYTYSVLGEGLAWVIGWSLILEYALGSAAVATGWSAHMSGLLHARWHIDLPDTLRAGMFDHDPAKGGVPGGVINLFAGLIGLVVTGLLILGTRESASVNIVLVLIKLVALAAFIFFAFPAIRPEHYQPFMPEGFWPRQVGGENYGVLGAAATMFFAFYGFDAVSTSAEECKNPGRDLTIGIVGSMIICTIVYMLVAAVAIGAVPFTDLGKTAEPLPYALRVLNQPLIGDLVGFAAVLAMPSVLLVFMYGQSRILFVMARDGLIPQGLAKVNKNGLPVGLTLLIGLCGLSAAGGYCRIGQFRNLSRLYRRVRRHVGLTRQATGFKTQFQDTAGVVGGALCDYRLHRTVLQPAAQDAHCLSDLEWYRFGRLFRLWILEQHPA